VLPSPQESGHRWHLDGLESDEFALGNRPLLAVALPLHSVSPDIVIPNGEFLSDCIYVIEVSVRSAVAQMNIYAIA